MQGSVGFIRRGCGPPRTQGRRNSGGLSTPAPAAFLPQRACFLQPLLQNAPYSFPPRAGLTTALIAHMLSLKALLASPPIDVLSSVAAQAEEWHLSGGMRQVCYTISSLIQSAY